MKKESRSAFLLFVLLALAWVCAGVVLGLAWDQVEPAEDSAATRKNPRAADSIGILHPASAASVVALGTAAVLFSWPSGLSYVTLHDDGRWEVVDFGVPIRQGVNRFVNTNGVAYVFSGSRWVVEGHTHVGDGIVRGCGSCDEWMQGNR